MPVTLAKSVPVDTRALSDWRADDTRTTPLETIYFPGGETSVELRGAIDREAHREAGRTVAACEVAGWTLLRTPAEVAAYFAAIGTD